MSERCKQHMEKTLSNNLSNQGYGTDSHSWACKMSQRQLVGMDEKNATDETFRAGRSLQEAFQPILSSSFGHHNSIQITGHQKKHNTSPLSKIFTIP